MKTKLTILTVLIIAIALFTSYECGQASPKSDKAAAPKADKVASVSSKIGVVCIRSIFQNCRRNAKYKEEVTSEQEKTITELEQLSKEIDNEKSGLRSLRTGSSDYMARVKEILEKQANLEAQREFRKQQIEIQDQRWTEALYSDILRTIGEVAKQKELDMVFDRDEPEFPSSSANELMLTIRTHKTVYSGGCADITNEVIGRLDAAEAEKQKTKG
jgi:Skp family chaperone for outer membrane proteins